MKLVDGFDSEYRYVLVAARRARQLQNGARPVVQPLSRKACRIAEQEIQAGMVKWVVPEPSKTPADVAEEMLSGAVGGESDD
jgi:DNA-directed RNA polymerase subunit omega